MRYFRTIEKLVVLGGDGFDGTANVFYVNGLTNQMDTTLFAGDNGDTFNVTNCVGPLTLFGGNGDDSFIIDNISKAVMDGKGGSDTYILNWLGGDFARTITDSGTTGSDSSTGNPGGKV